MFNESLRGPDAKGALERWTIDPVAKKWAPEFKADGWTVAQTKKALSALVKVAIEATTTEQDLLLSMSL